MVEMEMFTDKMIYAICHHGLFVTPDYCLVHYTSKGIRFKRMYDITYLWNASHYRRSCP